jgi:hypothetical protein
MRDTLEGVDLVTRPLSVMSLHGWREAKRGVAATDDFEHEYDGRANVRFRDFPQDAARVPHSRGSCVGRARVDVT